MKIHDLTDIPSSFLYISTTFLHSNTLKNHSTEVDKYI